MNIKNNPKWIANLLIVLFLGWLFYFGRAITGRAFCDSDTCWLLEMGRWIMEHRALPMVDPFSSGVSTFATMFPGTPLVQYQWLCEILFYSIYKSTGTSGLLILMSVLAFVTFIVLPYLSLIKYNTHRVIVFTIIFSVATLGGFCYYLRPQIFSFLFVALLIYLYIPTSVNLKRTKLSVVVFTLVIMMLWANMHILFPLGIIFMLLILVARFAETQIINRGSQFSLFQFLVPFISIIPTSINPWGISIWMYIDRLRNNTYCDLITELQPVQILNWCDPLALYLWLLLIVYVLLCVYYRAFTLSRLGFVSPLLAIAGLYMSLHHCKLAPVTSLFIWAACVELISRQSNIKMPASDAVSALARSWNTVGKALEGQLSNTPVWLCIMLVTVISGTVYASIYNPVTIPQSSESLRVPFKAIDYLKTHRPPGKILNEPAFGSVMIWYLNNPDVFFDTRFSEYEPQRLPDSIHIENCEPGWKRVWSRYDFDWAFLRPSRKIVKALRQMGWKTAYEDETAVILIKP